MNLFNSYYAHAMPAYTCKQMFPSYLVNCMNYIYIRETTC